MKLLSLVAIVLTACVSFVLGHASGAANAKVTYTDIPQTTDNSSPLVLDSLHEESSTVLSCELECASWFENEAEVQNETYRPEGTKEVTAESVLNEGGEITGMGIPLASIPLSVVPDVVIDEYIGKFLDPDVAARIEDPREFAERLVDVVTSDDLREAPVVGRVDAYVSLSPVSGFRPIGPSVNLGRFTPVYLHLMSEDYSNIDVLVKWKHLSSGTVIRLDQVAITESQPTSYRGFSPRDGWQSGRYHVTVYDMHNDNTLLSSLNFQVEDVYEQSTQDARQIDHEAINEMLSVGKAVVKNR